MNIIIHYTKVANNKLLSQMIYNWINIRNKMNNNLETRLGLNFHILFGPILKASHGWFTENIYFDRQTDLCLMVERLNLRHFFKESKVIRISKINFKYVPTCLKIRFAFTGYG